MNIQKIAPGEGGAIESVAARIQDMPAETRWLHARPDVIYSMATGRPIERGKRTRTVERALSAARTIGLDRTLARAGSFALLVGSYLGQFRTPSRTQPVGSLFVGIGALREASLIKDLENERKQFVCRLNETNLRSFAEAQRVGLWAMICEWRAATDAVRGDLNDDGSGQGLNGSECLIAYATLAHRYAYFRAWFRKLREHKSTDDRVVFSAASIPAFAAVSVGIEASYYIHGFQRQSLVYPDFSYVRCFTLPEATHMSRRLPMADVRLKEEPAQPVKPGRSVAIAGCYGQTTGFDACADFVEWAAREKLPVVIRIHPLDKTLFFERWRKDPNVTIVDASSSFDAFLDEHRPRLMLSWYSTALYDALRRGVVPVTVSTQSDQSLDVVFPFSEISLKYPADARRMADLIAQDEMRGEWLTDKRAAVGIGAPKS